MNAEEILTTLKKLGKPQTAAIYKRHGSGDKVFGVLTSEIAKLQKKIKVDHALAMELWKTGNAEARVLALQVADPVKLTRADADGLVKDGPVRFVGCYLSGLLARSPIAEKTMRAWMTVAGRGHAARWATESSAFRLKDDPDSVSDADAGKVLATIEKEIHRSPNWARYAMNGALISIGVYKPALRKKAHRGGQAHRQGRGRPRRDELQDARRRSLHREGVEAEALPVTSKGESLHEKRHARLRGTRGHGAGRRCPQSSPGSIGSATRSTARSHFRRRKRRGAPATGAGPAGSSIAWIPSA